VWVTAQALTALAGKAFPLGPVRRARATGAGGGAGAPPGSAAAARANGGGSGADAGARAGGGRAPAGLVRAAALAGLAAGYLLG
jgi:hypothetical protein